MNDVLMKMSVNIKQNISTDIFKLQKQLYVYIKTKNMEILKNYAYTKTI